MEILIKIEEQFTIVRECRAEMKGHVDLLTEQKETLEKNLDNAKNDYKVMESVLDVLRQYAVIKEQVLREKIDKIVTKGLQLIFGQGYESKLEFGINRGQAVIKPKIITEVNGEKLEADVAEAHGGGIVNIVAVIYQMIVLALVKPRQKQVLFLDEPFKNVSQEYLEATAEFIKQLNEKLNIQIILITHRKELHGIADELYQFHIENGLTKVRKLNE